MHVLSDANGLPLLVGVSAAHTHDSHALQPMIQGLPAIRSRRGPRRRKPARLRADKAYDSRPTGHGCASAASSRASPAAASTPATASADTAGRSDAP